MRKAGSLDNQYLDRMNDLAYLQNAGWIDVYTEGYHGNAQRILFPSNSTMKEKETLVSRFLQEQGIEELVYFIAETEKVPRLFTVQDVNEGEWSGGVNSYRNRLILVKTKGNTALLDQAVILSANGIDAEVAGIWSEGDFIYVDLETENILDFSYPNAISVRYEEK